MTSFELSIKVTIEPPTKINFAKIGYMDLSTLDYQKSKGKQTLKFNSAKLMQTIYVVMLKCKNYPKEGGKRAITKL